MAKSQKKRARRRHNPMRVPDTHLPPGSAAAAQTSTRAESVLPIMQKLDSSDERDRVWACAAISNVIQNDPSTRRLLQSKNVVGVLVNKLSDPASEVVSEAAGALRNLCVDGGFDICAEMYNKGILSPLQTSVSQIADAMNHYLDPQSSLSRPMRRVIAEFAENIITILTCLSEASHKALAAINGISPAPFLMSFIHNCQKLPLAAVTAAAHCLYVLSDENDLISDKLRASSENINAIIRAIRYNPVEEQQINGANADMIIDDHLNLQPDPINTEDQRFVAFRLLSCGILNNISPLPAVMPVSTVDLTEKLLLPELLPVLSISLPELASHARSLASIESDSAPRTVNSTKGHQTDHLTEQERELRSLEQRLTNIQFALEILTAISATMPFQPTEVDLAEAEDEIDEVDFDAHLEDNASTKGLGVSPGSITSLTKLLPILNTPLLHLARSTELSFSPQDGPAVYPPITRGLALIHIRALECLNNLFLSLGLHTQFMPLSPVDIESAASVWQELLSILANTEGQNHSSQEQRSEIRASALGALWGVARVCKGHLLATQPQVSMLLDFFTQAKDDGIKVKCIGALECLAQTPTAIEQNQLVANFLFHIIQNPATNQAESYIQAISAVIDIYSDEEAPYDANFRHSGWLQSLRDAVGPLRSLVRGIDRRKLGERELRLRGEEVLLNLRGFIQYREPFAR